MIKHFVYKKKDGSVSERFVTPITNTEDKLFCVDLTEYSDDEITYYEDVLDKLHKDYIQSIKDAGLSSNFRYFFNEGIQYV